MNLLIISILTFILLGINISISNEVPTMRIYVDYFSIIILVCWFVAVVKRVKVPFLSNIYFCLTVLTTVCISIILEHGIFLTEIQEITYRTGLPTRAAMQVFLLFGGLFLGYSCLDRYIRKIEFFRFDSYSNFLIERSFVAVVIISFLTLLGIFLIYGFPFLMSLHRQNYWASYAPEWGATLVNAIIQFNLGLGYLFYKKKSKIYLNLMLISIFVLFCAGVRFTGIITTLFLFFTPFIVLNANSVRLLNKKVIVASGFILSFVVVGIFLGFQSLDDVSTSERFFTRVSLQPQMWWITDLNSSVFPRDIYLAFVHYLGFGAEPKSVGPYFFMYQFAPTYVAESLFETGSTFTSVGVFNHVYFFGYFLGGLLNFIYGLVLAFCTWLFVSSVRSNNLIIVLLVFRLMYTMQIVIVSATNYQLFTFKYLLFLLVIMLLIVLSMRKNV
ncbi:hypothetical protein GCM10025882_00500 [Acinetobacter gyllenbergii]|uniref:DUF6418 domain-containing protein n=1 Tax=Acinetobacter gyllenbergii CIP 110306 = MTCC 11365 TaxID=1217657 RepID=A0A829HCZ7_9GAMM|nr:DUF6418 domain-containing protein [Acinetobacter gyllenbergii]EPF74825.1 hypothetical protein F957_03431 [Acinetobacter gyllenbergii CIP 110306 = MTCC 11365]EPH31741.1 hypothetical protein L293_1932 [Acinetobacter gyllenbergii CIP 110306 = MTCC 11365]GMA09626.1 hypothetical protein GCM10025882_00500 [Acinetobacter gyllenbergii]